MCLRLHKDVKSVTISLAIINKDPSRVEHLMTPQYYLATLAKPEELEVLVGTLTVVSLMPS